MQEILSSPYAWLMGLVVVVPVVAIVFGSLTSAWEKIRKAEIDAALKHEMIQRGMSADEIRQVLEASSKGRKSKKGSCGSASQADDRSAVEV